MKCPLCQKECNENAEEVLPPSFTCPTYVRIGGFGGRYSTHSHFIKYSTGGWATGIYYLERAVIPPYKLENHLCESTTYREDANGERLEVIHKPHSSIYVMDKNPEWRPGIKGVNKTTFSYTLRTPLIHMDIEDKLKERLKLILLLS